MRIALDEWDRDHRWMDRWVGQGRAPWEAASLWLATKAPEAGRLARALEAPEVAITELSWQVHCGGTVREVREGGGELPLGMHRAEGIGIDAALHTARGPERHRTEAGLLVAPDPGGSVAAGTPCAATGVLEGAPTLWLGVALAYLRPEAADRPMTLEAAQSALCYASEAAGGRRAALDARVTVALLAGGWREVEVAARLLAPDRVAVTFVEQGR